MIANRVRQSIVDALKSSRLKVAVQVRNDRITLSRVLAGQVLRVDLVIVGDELWVEPCKYAFQSKNSHFDYAEPEHRWTRRKTLIFQLVDLLRSTGVWSYVSNKTFFSVNKECTDKRSTVRTAVAKQYHDALHGDYTKAPVVAMSRRKK